MQECSHRIKQVSNHPHCPFKFIQSSRFGSLLCHQQVVLKVEPHFVDSFHFQSYGDSQQERQPLLPWRHYVPVCYDLSDLHQRAAWVLDPANAAKAAQIQQRANQWCRRHMTHQNIAEEYLDIWQAYLHYLDVADPEWSRNMWQPTKEAMFAPHSGYDMIKLS